MTQPTRPYDALYDPTFTVAGARDHYRQQTLGGGFNIERAPIYNNFFSELPHHPPSTLRLKNGDRIPAFIDRNYRPQPHDASDLQQRSDALAVSGGQRPKYFRRPLLAAAEIHVKQAPLPPLPQYHDLNATAPAALGGSGGPEPRSKTIGTQSDYRENEAQTAPWEPGYVLPEHPSIKQQALSKRFHTDGPEVLHLRDMAFADGLPAGLQEVTRIDKMRAKRAFEATLPPIDDAARLPLRQKMIEEWEAREWEEREQEILDIQERRLELLENALQVREEELDEEHQSRVEERKKATLAARAGRFADVQATRIKTMRQLIENRKYVEKHRKLHKPTIVERYANFGSGTYAPLQREGRFPESKPMGQEIETEGYEPASLKAVLELESFLPNRLLNPKVAAPRRPDRLDYAQRKEAGVQRDLKTINDLLDVSKTTAGRGFGDCWPAPLKEDSMGAPLPGSSGSLKRASSSSLSKLGQAAAGAAAGAGGGGGGAGPPAIAGGLASTATLPLMPAGSSGVATVAAGLSTSPSRRVVRAVERPSTPELPVPPTLSQPQHAAIVLLQRLLRGRAAQNIMYEGRLRRQELIDELRLGERLSPDGARLDDVPIRRPEERDAATLRVDALLGSAVAEVCAVLSESDPGRREVLAAALDTSRAHAAAAQFAAAATELSNAAAAAVTAAAADLAAAAGRSSSSSLAAAMAPPAVEPPSPLLREAALGLEALGITREQAEEAATRIQAAFHGHKARKEVAAMRARGAMLRRIMADGEEAKVVKCQAAVRGFLGRKRVAAMRAQQQQTDAKTEPEQAGQEKEEEAAAEAEAVLFDPSSYTPEQVEAAKRIQAVQRGRLARRRVAEMRAMQRRSGGAAADTELGADEQEEAAAASALKAEVEAPLAPKNAEVPSDYTVEQQVAVIKIQAAGRGYLARRKVAMMRQEAQQSQEQDLEGEDVAQRRGPVIGRQGDPELYAAASLAAAAAEAAAAAAAEAAAAGGEEGETLWPKMSHLSDFVLTPAAPAGGDAAVLAPAYVEGAEALAAESSQQEGQPEEAEDDASAPPVGAGDAEAEVEASLVGDAFGGSGEAVPQLPEEGEPSLAVGSSGSGDGGEASEPRPEASAAGNDGETAEEQAVGQEEGEDEVGADAGEGEDVGAGEASQAGPEGEGGAEEGAGGEEAQAGEDEGGARLCGEAPRAGWPTMLKGRRGARGRPGCGKQVWSNMGRRPKDMSGA